MMSVNGTHVELSLSTVVSPTVAEGESDLWKWIGYTVQGGLMFGLNIPITATVARFEALFSEKQYIIIAGLAAADAMNGLAYFSAGIYRSYTVLAGTSNVLVTSWECLWRAHNLLWIWTDTAAPSMLLVVSVDRLLSVAFPLQYLTLPREYASGFVAVAFAFSLLSGAIGAVSSYWQPSTAMYENVCFTPSATGPAFYTYHGMINTSLAFASIVVYMIVGVLVKTYYRNRMRKLFASDTSNPAVKKQAKQQRQMTVSMSISSLFTFFLYCLPFSMATFFSVYEKKMTASLGVYSWMLSNINPMLNAVIYLTRHREMRMGVSALFTGKIMGPTLQGWLNQPLRVSTTIGGGAGGTSASGQTPRHQRQDRSHH